MFNKTIVIETQLEIYFRALHLKKKGKVKLDIPIKADTIRWPIIIVILNF